MRFPENPSAGPESFDTTEMQTFEASGVDPGPGDAALKLMAARSEEEYRKILNEV
jgi:hypothetical protein